MIWHDTYQSKKVTTMDTNLEGFCPYAPYSSVLTVIRHMRERNLKEPVTSQFITTIGVSGGNAARTISALRFLKLLDEEGYITLSFRSIENATDEQYPKILSETLHEAYEHVFMALDPTTASDQQLKNAFLYYQPKTQRPRMTMLFKGLAREAGIISGGTPEIVHRPHVEHSKSSKSSAASNGARKPKSEPKDSGFQSELYQASAQPASHSESKIPITSTQEYVIMHGVLNKLPFATKVWTQAERDKWLKAVAANVEMLFELEDPNTRVG